MTSIEVTQSPDKAKIGEELDFSAIEVTATYDDNTTKPVTITAANISDFNKDTAETQTVTVTYGGKSDTFEIAVLAFSGIKVTFADDLEHILIGLGEDLDLEDIIVTAIWKNEDDDMNVIEEVVEITLANISDFNKSAAGEQTVTVTYNEKFVTFEVTVMNVDSIEVTKQPTKDAYIIGDTLNLTGLELTVTFDDGEEEIVHGHTLEAHNVSGFDSSTVGEKTVTITYGAKTTTFTVTVVTVDEQDFGPSASITKIFTVPNLEKWNEAMTTITDGGNDKNYIIDVTGDFAVAGTTTANFGTTVTGIKVAIRGSGKTISLSSNGSLLHLGATQTVILRDITLKGRTNGVDEATADNNYPLVYVNYSGTSGSTLVMREGAKITGNTYTGTNGGGVHVANYGTFTMYGGEISGNATTGSTLGGGGVHVTGSGATFTMYDGKISGNKAGYQGGGVYIANYGTFTMNGGEISDNDANSSCSGVYVTGANATFTMNNGKISSNEDISTTMGGGVGVSAATFTMNGGEISGHSALVGGGVYVSSGGNFTMNKGKIFGNKSTGTTSTNYGGGGVYVTGNNSTFTMEGGEIYGNTAVYTTTTNGGSGGGVCVYTNGSFTMKGGKIFENQTPGYGGGVTVNATTATNGGKFTMEGGEISDNTASYSGGGVYVYTMATFTMKGGEISGNTASSSGGGVYVGATNITNATKGGTFTMEDGKISGNKAGTSGGGVYVNYYNSTIGGIFIMEKGEISGNEASGSSNANRLGGGVYVGPYASFTMKGGKISGNKVSTNTMNYGRGGGVYVMGTFTMEGGEISGNEAANTNASGNTSGTGGGVSVSGTDAKFYIVTGTIYGSDADGDLKNTAAKNGATLYCDSGVAQHGTFDASENWTGTDMLESGIVYTNDTIKVEDGELVTP